MELARDGVLLRVFAGEADREGGQSLYRAVIEAALEAGLAGATALRGPLSYGSRQLNFEFNVDAPGNLPMVVEIIDSADKIEAFLPQLDSMIGSGLVTLEMVRMARLGRRTSGALEFSLGNEAPSAPSPGQLKEEAQMEVPHEAVLLRIFTGNDDRCGVEEPLYLAIVMKAREMHLAGATVLRGPLGFGHSRRLHKGRLLATDDRPVIIEICDAVEKINAFLPVLDGMMESGLVTIEKARVIQYGRERTSYLERLKQSMREQFNLGPTTGKRSGPVRL